MGQTAEQLTDQQFAAFVRQAVFSIRDIVGSSFADELTTVFATTDRKVVVATIHELFTSLLGKAQGEARVQEFIDKSV